MKELFKLACVVTVSCWAANTLGQGTSFSADMVQTATGESAERMKQLAAQTGKPVPTTFTWKVYRSGTKMRIDMSSGPQQGSAITDLSGGGKSYMLQHREKTYFEYDSVKKGQELEETLQYLKAGGDLCQLRTKYPSCRKLAAEVVVGRSCQGYEVATEHGDKETLCVDDRLRFPIREVKKSGTMEIRNIVESAQPAGLFEIPSGYTKAGK